MPEKRTIERARKAKREGKSASTQAVCPRGDPQFAAANTAPDRRSKLLRSVYPRRGGRA
jgi:hypothetical protein